jgi:hypothetical protein
MSYALISHADSRIKGEPTRKGFSTLALTHANMETQMAQAASNNNTKATAMAYAEFLDMELRLLQRELGLGRLVPRNTLAKDFHFPVEKPWDKLPKPSTRAVTVMRAAGLKV